MKALARVAMVGACAAAALGPFGCIAVPKASAAHAERARRFAPPPGRSGLYVLRPALGPAVGLKVLFDHEEFGPLVKGSFLYAEVLPREHVIELTGVGHAKDVSLLVKPEPGRCYFYEMSASFGELQLRPLEEEEGRRMVADLEAAQTTFDAGEEVAPKAP